MAMTDNLEKMLASGRDDAMLRFGLGSAYFNSKDYAKAVPHLQACIAHDESYSAAYKLLGKSHFQLKDYQQAKQVLDEGLAIANAGGDKQSVKEIEVFLKKIAKDSLS